MDESTTWLISDNGVQLGPFTSQEVQMMVGRGQYTNRAAVWREGWETWKPLADVFPKPASCPGCNTQFKSGITGKITFLSKYQHELILKYNQNAKKLYCTKCGSGLLTLSRQQAKIEITNRANRLKDYLRFIPVVTAQHPQGWEYDTLHIATAQSTTGTGFLSEFTSSFSDLFGTQSNQYNRKLKAGEDFCFQLLRLQALRLGGNAIIAVDIDYSEMGTTKGLLMVCTAGTVIRLRNPEVLGQQMGANLEATASSFNELEYIRRLLEKSDAD